MERETAGRRGSQGPDPIVLCRMRQRLEWFISVIKYALNIDVTKTHDKRMEVVKKCQILIYHNRKSIDNI